jgi:small subunit ribosomal protein S20
LPNIKSAKKRVSVVKKKTLRNKMLKSSLRTALRKASVPDSSTDVKLQAIRALDKAVGKGIIHKNNAARKKSSISKQMSIDSGVRI